MGIPNNSGQFRLRYQVREIKAHSACNAPRHPSSLARFTLWPAIAKLCNAEMKDMAKLFGCELLEAPLSAGTRCGPSKTGSSNLSTIPPSRQKRRLNPSRSRCTPAAQSVSTAAQGRSAPTSRIASVFSVSCATADDAPATAPNALGCRCALRTGSSCHPSLHISSVGR